MTTQEIETARYERGVAIVVVRGEHDLYSAPALRERLADPLQAGNALVVDLSPATFVDSSILGVLLGALRRAREQESPFALVLASDGEPGVRRIFEVTGLLDVFAVYDTPDGAVSTIGPEGS